MRFGKSCFTYADGSEYIGQFVDDQADGHGIFIDFEGNRYTWGSNHKSNPSVIAGGGKQPGYFKDAKLFGNGEILYKNRDKYSGQFKNSLRHGEGHMEYFVLKAEYTGSWKRNKREGVGTMIFEDGKTFKGIWVNDLPSIGELSIPNGNNFTFILIFIGK